ncbi:helix-turn-helix domain-containing protein [Haloplanus rubicundus]|nr:helix-turn-helix domain-containing protein [Haloplanus rubicundus]
MILRQQSPNGLSMGVIADVRIPTHQFEFGRRFPVRNGDATEIERVESVGDGETSIFSFSEPFEERPASGIDDPFVDVEECRLEVLEEFDGQKLYVITWEPSVDPFFGLLDDYDGIVRRGTGTADTWTFETRFPSHDALAAFRSACVEAKLGAEVERVYNPTRRDAGAWYGLTPRQRRTLELAVERGYYDIPRRCTTIELADELGISDQAVTERLRRGIVTFVTNALLFEEGE